MTNDVSLEFSSMLFCISYLRAAYPRLALQCLCIHPQVPGSGVFTSTVAIYSHITVIITATGAVGLLAQAVRLILSRGVLKRDMIHLVKQDGLYLHEDTVSMVRMCESCLSIEVITKAPIEAGDWSFVGHGANLAVVSIVYYLPSLYNWKFIV